LKGDIVYQKVGSLSGGEKSKVALAKVAALNANVLILDEPTNHLDLWSRAALETALREFDGTLLFVSHDRYFMDRVATQIFAFEPTRWRLYAGNYSNYVDSLRRAREGASAAGVAASQGGETTKGATAVAPQSKETVRRKRRFPYRKVEDLEAEISQVETDLAQIQGELGNPDLYREGQRVKEVRERFDGLQVKLASLYEHWEEAVELN
jgi:ATP-binding cassette subfamily F protein 3